MARVVASAAPVFLLLLALQVQGLSIEVKSLKERPVSKVISLLKDMTATLAKEAEEDEEIYDKLECWCTTNDREKSKAVAEADSRVADLTNKIEELTATSSRLTVEIKSHNKEVAKNQESLDQATALRREELAAFNAEEKDLLGSISALKAAITVLSKHHTSLLQVDAQSRHVRGVATTLQHEMKKHEKMLAGVLTHSERKAVLAFIQAPSGSYAPQSGEIFGILKQMHETFESNLEASQKQEAESQAAYEALKAAKETEIAAGKDQIDAKSTELADTDQKNAQAKQDVTDTSKSLAADKEFLAVLKEKCEMADKEYEERVKTRNLEVEAVSKALTILNGDDAHDLFTRTFNPSLLQRSSDTSATSNRREKASELLMSMAKKTGSRQLAQIAALVRLDAFDRVKKAIADLVTQLLKEKDDEIKHKDFCVEEFHSNEEQTDKATRSKHELNARIEDLDLTTQSLEQTIDGLKADVAETQAQLKRAGENRELENKEFQSTIADQRETQKVLASAQSVLADFYEKAALVQQDPPAGFSEYTSNAGGKGVLDLLKTIIADTKSAEGETIRSEEDAQKAYEDFVKESNASIEAKSKDIVNKSENKAKAEADLVAAKEGKANTDLELEQLSNYNAQLHQSCDFVLKNFDLRQASRDDEVEALRQATAILSGANFEAFLERRR